MAKAGHVYPQVEPRAADLMDARVTTAQRRWSVNRALAAARASGASVIAADLGTAARVADIERAAAWGLGRTPWIDLAYTGLPAVSSSAAEITVRRLLRGGASMVLVRDGRCVAGMIKASARLGSSLAGKLERLHGSQGEATLWLLRTAGKLGEAQGHAAYAAGGFVRDLLLGRGADQASDIDLVAEGDGIAFGRRLAEETGGHLVVHAAFATASLEGGTTPDGTRIGRVDIATARHEHYREAGTLPEVSPAGIDEDLARRDFSINAMAVALSPSAWGRLHDPWGGAEDVAARRLKVLHPLSLVEDPTRIWRGARYAARLGLRPDAGFRRALALSSRVGQYPALSGQRLQAELDLVMDEEDPWRALGLVLSWDALRLWDGSYRVTGRSRTRLAAARSLLRWARDAHITVDGPGLALLALLFDQSRPVVDRCVRRLAIAGGPAARLDAGAARNLARRLACLGPRRPSRVAEALRSTPDGLVLGAWLAGGRAVRHDIEWFLREGRAERPLSSGDDVVAAGVPRGPLVGQALGLLRDLRLDGRVRTMAEERAAVAEWMKVLVTKGDLR
jgi:tRNA nucleotidyltransferase (CCA-adding enzyme)